MALFRIPFYVMYAVVYCSVGAVVLLCRGLSALGRTCAAVVVLPHAIMIDRIVDVMLERRCLFASVGDRCRMVCAIGWTCVSILFTVAHVLNAGPCFWIQHGEGSIAGALCVPLSSLSSCEIAVGILAAACNVFLGSVLLVGRVLVYVTTHPAAGYLCVLVVIGRTTFR
jgi:hypothetical protein